MSRGGLLILLMSILLITPFSGLPEGFRTYIIIAFALVVLIVGVTLRTSHASSASQAALPLEDAPPQAIG